MTDAYFYVNIPYHRPATPSFPRLLQRWAGPILLGTVLAALAWHQDHLVTPTPAVAINAGAAAALAPSSPGPDPVAGYSAAADAGTLQATQATPNDALLPAEHTAGAAHPALVFHNCSMPRMEVRKDRNDLITGVASVSSCDEAKVTLWDTSR